MTRRSHQGAAPAAPASPMLALFTARNVLAETEIADSLLLELARERDEADAAMARVIEHARTQTYFLSWAIFEPIEELERTLATSEAALERNRGDRSERYIASFTQQSRVELATGRHLRAIRASVAHADPPDYWERRRAEAMEQPILVYPQWRDTSLNGEGDR